MSTLSHKIVRNTAFNALGRFWSILVGIFLTPYIIYHIGIERFGVWAIIGVVTGYFGLLDFGIGLSFVKYVAEFYTKREYGRISDVVNTGFVLYSLLAICATALVLLLKDPLLTLLNVPAPLHHEAAIILAIGIALFGVSNAVSPFGAIQGGLQRMDISNNAYIAVSLLNIAGTVYVLEKGYGLIGLMLNNVAVFAVSAAINIIVAFRILPELRFRLTGFDRATCAMLFRFGSNTQVAKVSGMMSNQIDKLYITCLLSIGLVTYYQLGSSIVYYATTIAAILTSAVMPAFSEIEAKGERPRLVEAYLRSARYLSFLTIPLFVFIIISAFQIMAIWMGAGFEKTGFVIQLLALAWMIPTIMQVSVYVAFAIDKPQFLAAGSLVVVGLNVVLSFIFIKAFGFYGAAWGTLVAVHIGTGYFVWRVNAYLKVPLRKMAGTILPYIGAGVVAAAVVVCADGVMAALRFHPGRIGLALAFIARGAAFLAVYLAGVIRFGLLTPDDIALIGERLPFMRSFGKDAIA